MRDWSDEWKTARLALELRNEELFQGETVVVFVNATIKFENMLTDLGNGEESQINLGEQSSMSIALHALEERWRSHCDGALVDLKVVEPPSGLSSTKRAPPPQHSQPRATLFHQESRMSLLPFADKLISLNWKSLGQDNHTTTRCVTLRFRCEFTIRVRAEFWHRPLALIARITPTSEEQYGNSTLNVSLPAIVLTDEFMEKNLLKLLREEISERPSLMRRVEAKLCVVKPLVIRMETRHLSDHQVAIIAKGMNTHNTMPVRVLDLQLHLDQFINHSNTGSSGTTNVRAISGKTFHIVRGVSDSFPIELRPHEQYNFVFVLQLITEIKHSRESDYSSNVSAPKSNVVASLQSLLTVTWDSNWISTTTCTSCVPSTSPIVNGPSLQAITEHHTIIWSPHHPKATTSLAELKEWNPRVLSPPLGPAIHDGTIHYARRDHTCPLRVSVVPLNPINEVHVGQVVALCVVVANTDTRREFDVTLVLPHLPHSTWIAFEGAHPLGLIKPGITIRKSVRLVFLRIGRSDMNALLLFDHISRTWFLPTSSSNNTAISTDVNIACANARTDIFVRS